MLYRLLYQHRGKELVERGVCRVIRVAATNCTSHTETLTQRARLGPQRRVARHFLLTQRSATTFATAVANAELIRTSRIESQIDALMEMEFDDDYIQEDGKAFQKNLYGKKAPFAPLLPPAPLRATLTMWH